MIQWFDVPGRLSGANEYTGACRRNPHAGAKMKRDNQDRVCAAIAEAGLRPMRPPVHIHYTWCEAPAKKGARLRDKGNIAFADKFVQDALVECGVIPDDGWDVVDGFDHRFFRARIGQGRVHVEIEEVRP